MIINTDINELMALPVWQPFVLGPAGVTKPCGEPMSFDSAYSTYINDFDLEGVGRWDVGDFEPLSKEELARLNSEPVFNITVYTASSPTRLSKGFRLGADGLVKLPGGQMADGECHRAGFVSMSEFAEFLSTLDPSNALGYGLPEHTRARVVTEGRINSTQANELPVIARTKGHFFWSKGAAIMMVDVDPPKSPGSVPVTPDQFLGVMHLLFPAIAKSPSILAHSASSHIWQSDLELIGQRGLRFYVLVKDGTDTERAGKALFKRLWMAGHGRIEISRTSGARFVRGLIDGAVWGPERLDFISGAACEAPLEQRRPAPLVFNDGAEPLDSSAVFPDLDVEEEAEFRRLVQEAKAAAEPEAKPIRETYAAKRAEEALARKGMTPESNPEESSRLREQYRCASSGGVLYGGFELFPQGGGSVTVDEILADPDSWHEHRFADPMEPDYGGDDRIALAYLKEDQGGGRAQPIIYSHAHGGQLFSLFDSRAFDVVLVQSGEGKTARRKQFERHINATEDFDELTEVIRGEVLDSGLPPPDMEMLLKMISKKAGVSVVSLRTAAEQKKTTDVHLDVAKAALAGYDVVFMADSFWTWTEAGVWRREHDQAVRQRIHAAAEGSGRVTQNFVNSVFDLMRTRAFKPEPASSLDKYVINLTNGELHWAGGGWDLRGHDRDAYRTAQIAVAYDPAATAPRFVQFLDEVFRGDDDIDEKKRLILEAIGYSLLATCELEKFFLLIGAGANGKSVLLAVLAALVGREAVAAVQPSQFENRFQRAHLHGKLVNIVTEIAEGHEVADAQLKAIVSGELTTAEHKLKPPFDFHPFATCWFGTNHMPHTRDFSNALFRRASIIQFNRTFAEHEQDPHLADKLKTELPGILAMAINALGDLLRRGRFTSTASGETAKKEWRLQCDQVAQFVQDKCELVPGARTSSGTIYKSYQSWAVDAGIRRTLGRNGFTTRLMRIGVETCKGAGGERMLAGVRLSTQEDDF